MSDLALGMNKRLPDVISAAQGWMRSFSVDVSKYIFDGDVRPPVNECTTFWATVIATHVESGRKMEFHAELHDGEADFYMDNPEFIRG